MADAAVEVVKKPEEYSSNSKKKHCSLAESNLEDEVTRKTLVSTLQDCGCCPRCQLRYQSIRWQTSYIQPKAERLKVEYANVVSEEGDQAELNKDKHQRDAIPVCPLCLGILQDLCEKQFIHKMAEELKSENYEFNSYAFTISLPLELLIRQHMFLLYLRESKGLKVDKNELVDIKDVFKWVCGPMMSSELNVPFRLQSPFELHMAFHNEETESEVFQLLSQISPKRKRRRFFKPKLTKEEPPTKQQVTGQLKQKSAEELKELFNYPPISPSSCMNCRMEGIHEPIFVAGRYNKYSRSLSQTPWILDGTRMTTSSVQELVCDPMKDFFRARDYNFVASGREDVDVKTLGRGRPFAAEMSCPHKTAVTDEDMRKLQNTINTQTTDIAVRDLQIVTREETTKVKEGEQEKTKEYSALVWVAKEVTKEMLDSFSKLDKLTLQQKTPIRVLHRRPLATREKLVHKISATPVDEHHFKLHLCTQAGTYIKEFVHGDFGRTQPNVSTILGSETDILALDVEAVNLDWPKQIDGQK